MDRLLASTPGQRESERRLKCDCKTRQLTGRLEAARPADGESRPKTEHPENEVYFSLKPWHRVVVNSGLESQPGERAAGWEEEAS